MPNCCDIRIQLNRVTRQFLPELTEHVDGFEVILETFIANPLDWLTAISGKPVSLHSVSIFPDRSGDQKLSEMIQRHGNNVLMSADLLSLHLARSSIDAVETGRLIPTVYNQRSLTVAVDCLRRIQDRLGRNVLFENISEYYMHPGNEMMVADYMYEVHRLSGASCLLDIENILINRGNFPMHMVDFSQLVSTGAVREVHVAGHSTEHGQWTDSHDANMSGECMALLANILSEAPNTPTVVLERDGNVEDATTLLDEINRIRETISKSMPVKS